MEQKDQEGSHALKTALAMTNSYNAYRFFRFARAKDEAYIEGYKDIASEIIKRIPEITFQEASGPKR